MMELRNFPCSVPSAGDSIATVDLSEIAAVEPWVYWRDGAQQPGSHVFLRGGGALFLRASREEVEQELRKAWGPHAQ